MARAARVYLYPDPELNSCSWGEGGRDTQYSHKSKTDYEASYMLLFFCWGEKDVACEVMPPGNLHTDVRAPDGWKLAKEVCIQAFARVMGSGSQVLN